MKCGTFTKTKSKKQNGLRTTILMSAIVGLVLCVSCNKKEPQLTERTSPVVKQELPVECGKEIIADKPVKVGETGMILPVGSKICITTDNLEVRVELPQGFAFLSNDLNATERTLPYFGTYACYCSGQGSACNVFYGDGLGFGCLQSSCTGACTGKFTYKGYSVDRVINLADKAEFFNAPDVQDAIRVLTKDVSALEAYGKFSVMGIPFYLVQDEKTFLSKATCDCEGTQACKLKTISLPLLKGEVAAKKIYYCEGSCNGCELTVN